MNTTTPRGPGRPRTRPAELVRLRCDVTPGELAEIDAACKISGRSKADFARESVVIAARKLLRRKGKKKSE